MDKVALVDALNVKRLFKALVNIYVSSATGVDEIVAERNAANKSNKELLTVVPHQLETL